MIRSQAWTIVQRYVNNENLRKHMLAVEAAMANYFQYFSEKRLATSELGNQEDWKIVGLLHDFDWEIHPTLDEHPQKGGAILEKAGLPEHLRRAILSHAEHTGVVRESLMEKTLFAVDELTGLIVATALVKERKLANVTVQSVLKKWKEKSFAKGVNRQDIEAGASQLGVPLAEHIQIVLTALQQSALSLGL